MRKFSSETLESKVTFVKQCIKKNSPLIFQEVYLGFPLFDNHPTIVHHFAFFNDPSIFPYPFVKAGVAFSIPLLNRSVVHHAR
jgi:hypothetical protein